MRQIFTSVIAIVCLVVPAAAQPLADRVPEGAIFYFGWCGSESMPPEYESSHLKAVLDASNVPELINEFLPQLMAKAAMQDREVGEAMDYIRGIAGPMWRHPTALYFTGVDFAGREPMPRIGLICEAGKDLQGLVDRLTSLKQKAGNDAPINWQVDGTRITVYVGAQPDPIGKGLVGNETFKAALSKVQAKSAVAMFIDGARAIALVDEAVQKSQDRDAMMYWPKIRDGAGLAGLGSIIWTSGFDGRDWADHLFVGAPAPRKGLLAWGDTPPIPDSLLKTIPGTATYFSAGAFDLAACLDSIRSIVGAVEPRGQAEFDKGMAMVNGMLGMDLQKDVLEPLGPQWVIYSDPNTAGFGLVGLVIVNKPDDPAKAEKGLNGIANLIANASAEAMRREGLSLPYRTTKVGDLTINYIAAPLVSPSWVVKDGNMYIGLYPQVVASAAQFGGAGKPSILENADFQAMRKRLGGTNVTSISYGDLRKTALESYQGLLAISRLGLGLADMWGVKSPELVMPTLDELLKHVSPTGSVTWADQEGFHMRSVCPFPGSQIMSGGAGIIAPLIGASALMGGISMPALHRARANAERVKSASNLRQIAVGVIMYTNDNKGELPASFDAIQPYGLKPEVFDSPLGDAPGGDYVYLGVAGLRLSQLRGGPTLALAYDNAALGQGQGTNVVFLDGHVEWVSPARFHEILAKSRAAGLTGGGGL